MRWATRIVVEDTDLDETLVGEGPFTRPLSVVAAFTAALLLAMPASASEKGDPDARFEMRMERLENAVKERLAPRPKLDEQTADRLAELLRQSAEEHKRARQKVWAERQALRAGRRGRR